MWTSRHLKVKTPTSKTNQLQSRQIDNLAFWKGEAATYQLEVERAQFFQARAELEPWVSSPNEPEPVKIALEPASSPSYLLIRMLKFEFEPTSSLLEN